MGEKEIRRSILFVNSSTEVRAGEDVESWY